MCLCQQAACPRAWAASTESCSGRSGYCQAGSRPLGEGWRWPSACHRRCPRVSQVPCCSQTSFVPTPEPGIVKGQVCGVGCHGGTESHPNYLSMCSHLGKLQFGKFGCTNISCLLNRSKYLGLCSLGLLKSAGGSVAVCMHGRGSRGVGHPAPTVAGDCDVG